MSKMSLLLQAFGIGALEEDDDEQVYGVESMTTYDVALAKEGDISMERRYGWTGGAESGRLPSSMSHY